MAVSEADFVLAVCLSTLAAIVVYKLVQRGVKLVRHAEVMIIERLGKYHTTLKPGLHWVWPIIDAPRHVNWRYLDAPRAGAAPVVVAVKTDRVDMREHVIDFGRQHVITKDTVQIMIDALLYFRITDARAAVYQIQNLPDAVELLTQATLRNIVAQMTLDDTFSSREQINTELLSKLQRDAERWGITVTRVEIFNIIPPEDIRNAMENQIKAERERRSTVLRADGERESAIIRSRGEAAQVVLAAEGARASALLRAKGQAEAKTLLADAEAECIKCIQQAVGRDGNAVEYLATVEYLNSLKSLGQGKLGEVVLVPVETVQGVQTLINLNRTQ